MKLQESKIYRFFAEVKDIVSSREKATALVKIPLYSNAIFLTISGVSSALLGFVFWMIAARFYSAAEVGLAGATIAGMGFVTSFSRLGLDIGIVRFLRQKEEDPVSIINTVFTIGILASLIVSSIFIAGLNAWSPALIFIRQNPFYLVIFIFFSVISTVSVFSDNSFVALRRTGFTAITSLVYSVLKIPLPIILAVFFKTFGIFTSWGLAMLMGVVIEIFIFLPKIQPGYRFYFTVKTKAVQNMVSFSFANYASNFLWGLPSSLFPIIVVNLLGAESNAYFYIAWALGGVLAMVPAAISTSLFAEGSYDETQLKDHINRSLKMVFVILIPAVILVFLLADKLLVLFGNQYSQSATTLVRILAITTLPLAVNIIYLNIARVQKDLKIIIGLTAFVAVVTLVLGYILIPRMGINGAGIAWLVAHGITALPVIVVLLRQRRKQTTIKANNAS